MRYLFILWLCLHLAYCATDIKKDVKDLLLDSDKRGWEITLKHLALNFSSTSIKQQKAYESFSDTRLKGDSQIIAETSALLHGNYYAKNFVFFNTIYGEYGRNIIYPQAEKKIDNTTLDRILFATDYTQKVWFFEQLFGGFDMGPYTQLSYQTQFAKINQRTHIVRLNAGIKLFNGSVIKNFYLSLFSEQDFTYANSMHNFGLNFGLNIQYELNKHVKLLNYLNFRQYFINHSSSQYNPQSELEFNTKIQTALFKNFSIAPYLSLYLLKGRLITKPAINFMLGISLSYGQTLMHPKSSKQSLEHEENP